MFERPRWIFRGAIVALTLLSFGHAHAGDDDRSVSDARAHRGLSDADSSTIAAYGRNDAEVIEEIIVVGNKKRQRLNPDRFLATKPTIEKPSRFDLQILPVYDPQEASHHSRLSQHDERIRGVGIVATKTRTDSCRYAAVILSFR